MSSRRRRSKSEPLVTLEVPQSVAVVLAEMTDADFLRLKRESHWTHKLFSLLQTALTVFLIAVVFFVWGPLWDWRDMIYKSALAQCTTTMSTVMDKTKLNLIVTEDMVSQTCQELISPLKPPLADKPWDRLLQVWSWTGQSAVDWVEGLVFTDHSKNLDSTSGGIPGGIDFSGETDANGNPSLRAVVQEAIKLQASFKVPWRYVVDACFYESGGLKQYASTVVLTQGVNRNSDGSVSSTDWGLCQINDKWHPDLIEAAKESWKGNLKASFTVFEPRWEVAQNFPDGEERQRVLWALYNGSGPYDAYATRVFSIHQTLEPRIAQILREFENSASEGSPSASLPDGSSIVEGKDDVVVIMNTKKDVPVFDGESANIVEWAILNKSWEIENGRDWRFCQQTDSTGWVTFKFAANIDAGGICANATQIDFATKRFGRGLTVDPYLKHWGNFPWFKVAINCPMADYVIHNNSGKTVVFEQFMDGYLLKLRIRFK